MALQTNIEVDDSGVIASYWRIKSAVVNFLPDGGATVDVTLNGWLSSDSREAGKISLTNAVRLYNLSFDDSSKVEGLTRQILYETVKIYPDFANAEDI